MWIVLSWIFFPTYRTGAVYVPDTNGSPYWISLAPGDNEPGSGPGTADPDSDGVPVWYDQFQAAASSGAIAWWSGGSEFGGVPFVVNGVLTTFAGQWHAAGGDADNDGIPDSLDLYIQDATNNSYWWPGGEISFDDRQCRVRAQWFSGSGACTNSHNVPDAMVSLLENLSTPQLFLWPGGSFLIEGQWSSFNPVYFYGYDTGDLNGDASDKDGDGIPNVLDIHQNDPWNGTYFTWEGGWWFVSGIWTPFEAGQVGGLRGPDSDADGIPDVLDPYVNDPGNNSVWWSGGTFWIDGTQQTLSGCHIAATMGDNDGDTIPDDLDPYRYDSTNNTAWWNGGLCVVNGSSVELPGQWHRANEADFDNDGIPDSLDSYPEDPSNNSFWWGGGSYPINNATVDFPAGWYAGQWSDPDGDGIPNGPDSYPNDSNNGNSGGGGGAQEFYWGGGTFPVNGAFLTWNAGSYPGTWGDGDGDGIPDSLDQYPADGNNNNPPMFWWGGGSFRIDGFMQTIAGQTCFGLPGSSTWGDTDHDGIPDTADPYPSDFFNNSPGFFWPPLDSSWNSTIVTIPMDSDNHPVQFTTVLYEIPWADADGDGVPDITDPHPDDYYNGNDTDSDGIPDSVEAQYGLDRLNADDAGNPRYVYVPAVGWQTDGLTWRQAWDNRSLSLMDNLLSPTSDADGDFIADVYEILNGLDPLNPNDAVDAPIGHLDPNVQAPVMDDYILNIEKARADIPLATVVDDPVLYEQITGRNVLDIPPHDFSKSVAENDWDDDGVSNRDEVRVFCTDPRFVDSYPLDSALIDAYFAGQTSVTTNIGFVTKFADLDSDGDLIPDLVEVRYGLNRNVDLDAKNPRTVNGQTDGLSWIVAYVNDCLEVLIPDLDGDGIPNAVETQRGLNLSYAGDADYLRYVGGQTDGLSWRQAYDNGLMDTLLTPAQDTDGDQIPDLVEIKFGLNRNDPTDAGGPRGSIGDYDDSLTWLEAYLKDTATLYYLSHLYVEPANSAVAVQTGVTTMELIWEHPSAATSGDPTAAFTIERIDNGTTSATISGTPSTYAVPWSDGTFGFHLVDLGEPGVNYVYRITYERFGGQPSATVSSPGITFLSEAVLAGMDSDGDGLSDLIEMQYGLNRFDASDADQPRNVGGVTDGLSWLEAFNQGYLDVLTSRNAVQYVLSSSVQDTRVPSTEVISYAYSSDSFNGSGKGEYIYTNPTTGTATTLTAQWLTGQDLAKYWTMKGLSDVAPASSGPGEWVSNWDEDGVTEIRDPSGEIIEDANGEPLLKGTWSGLHHVFIPQYGLVTVGATVSNDLIASLPPPPPLDATEIAGAWSAGMTYRFTDVPDAPLGSGEPITSSEYDGMREQWLTIAHPTEAQRALLSPGGGPITASNSGDGNASRSLFWLQTDNGGPAAREIVRTYVKTITSTTSPGATPQTSTFQLVIHKGQTLSDFVDVTAEPGQNVTVSLLTVEFKARNVLSEGFDPPLNGDKDPAGKKDEDEWVAWTSVCRNAPRNVNTLTKLVFGAGVDLSAFEIVPAAGSAQLISVTPRFLTANETNLTITALGEGNTIATATVEVQLKSNHSMVSSMKVMLLPERQTVKCRFFKLLETNDSLGFATGNPNDNDALKRWRTATFNGQLSGLTDATPGPLSVEIDTRFAQTAVFASPSAPEILPGTTSDGWGLREFPFKVGNNNRWWISGNGDLNNIDQNRALFTSQNKDGKDCIIVFVPLLDLPNVNRFDAGEVTIGYSDPITGFVFIGVDNWKGSIPALLAPENNSGASNSLARVLAHEFGHWLNLSTRIKEENDHDNDPHPTGTVPLMRNGGDGNGNFQPLGRWIRHEDWRRAKERAIERGL